MRRPEFSVDVVVLMRRRVSAWAEVKFNSVRNASIKENKEFRLFISLLIFSPQRRGGTEKDSVGF